MPQLQKKPHKTGDKKKCEEYEMEATIQKKMRLDKCDAYTAKETLGCRGRKYYVSSPDEQQKEKKNRKGQKKKQIYREIIGALN